MSRETRRMARKDDSEYRMHVLRPLVAFNCIKVGGKDKDRGKDGGQDKAKTVQEMVQEMEAKTVQETEAKTV